MKQKAEQLSQSVEDVRGAEGVHVAHSARNSRRARRVKWFATLILCAIVGASIFLAVRSPTSLDAQQQTQRQTQSPLVGKSVSDIRAHVLDAATGEPTEFSLRDALTKNVGNTTSERDAVRGHYVVVNFFATWCQPCREEFPALRTFAAQPDAPQMVSVVFDRTDENAAIKYMAENQAKWPLLQDRDGRVALEFGARALPETFVVAPNQKIVAHVRGKVTTAWLNTMTSGAAMEMESSKNREKGLPL